MLDSVQDLPARIRRCSPLSAAKQSGRLLSLRVLRQVTKGIDGHCWHSTSAVRLRRLRNPTESEIEIQCPEPVPDVRIDALFNVSINYLISWWEWTNCQKQSLWLCRTPSKLPTTASWTGSSVVEPCDSSPYSLYPMSYQLTLHTLLSSSISPTSCSR